MWGKCRGCEARDQEIAHLLALLGEANVREGKAAARVAEIVAPGVDARIAAQRREPRPPREHRAVATPMPGYPQEQVPSYEVEGP